MVFGLCAKCCPCEASEQNGAKNQNLQLRRKGFVSVIIQFKKECQNRMKNDRVMPIKRSHAKVAVGLFLPKVGYFGHIF